MFRGVSAVLLACLAAPAAAQQAQLPPLDPAHELTACRGQVDWNVNNARVAAGYAEQFRAEIAEMKKKLAEAEAKLRKPIEDKQ